MVGAGSMFRSKGRVGDSIAQSRDFWSQCAPILINQHRPTFLGTFEGSAFPQHAELATSSRQRRSHPKTRGFAAKLIGKNLNSCVSDRRVAQSPNGSGTTNAPAFGAPLAGLQPVDRVDGWAEARFLLRRQAGAPRATREEAAALVTYSAGPKLQVPGTATRRRKPGGCPRAPY